MEYVECGQVMDYDEDTNSFKTIDGSVLSEETARKYFRDLVQGMEYCKIEDTFHKVMHFHELPNCVYILFSVIPFQCIRI